MLIRVISGLVGIGLAVLVIGYGDILYLLAISFLTVVGLMEFYKMVRAKGLKPFVGTGVLSGLILIFLTYFNNNSGFSSEYVIPGIVLALFLIFSVQLFKNGTDNSIINVGVTCFGVIYVAGLMVHFILLRNLENTILPGKYAVWLALACTWAADSCAYFVGRSLGSKPLAAKISPKKTLEGFLGGIFGSGLAGILFGVIVGINISKILIIAIAIGFVGQIGDLFESSLKRDAGVKDSGNIIPGHGGILDRFDSALFTLPLTFYLIALLF